MGAAGMAENPTGVQPALHARALLGESLRQRFDTFGPQTFHGSLGVAALVIAFRVELGQHVVRALLRTAARRSSVRDAVDASAASLGPLAVGVIRYEQGAAAIDHELGC